MKVRVLAWLGLAVVFALAALAFAAAVAQDAGARVAPERVAQTTEFWIPNLDPNPGPSLLEDLSPGGLLGVTIHSSGEKALGGIRATILPAPDALADPEFFPPDETDVLTRDELLSMLAEWEGERISPPANSPPGKIGDAKVRRVLTDLPPLFVSDDRPERMDLLLDAAPASEVVAPVAGVQGVQGGLFGFVRRRRRAGFGVYLFGQSRELLADFYGGVVGVGDWHTHPAGDGRRVVQFRFRRRRRRDFRPFGV